MTHPRRTWSFLALATLLLLSTGVKAIRAGMDTVAAMGMSAGLILLGIWISLEVLDWRDRGDATAVVSRVEANTEKVNELTATLASSNPDQPTPSR